MIVKIDDKKFDELLEKFESNSMEEKDKKLFFLTEGELFVGVDNTGGDMFVEDFKSQKECFAWLNGKEINNIAI